jgi:hypothetical protein
MKLNKELLGLLITCGHSNPCITAKDIIEVVGDSKGNVSLTKSNLKKVKEGLKLGSFDALIPEGCPENVLSEDELFDFFNELSKGDCVERDSEYKRIDGIAKEKNIPPEEEDFYWDWLDDQLYELLDEELIEIAYEENVKLANDIKRFIKSYSKEQLVKYLVEDDEPKDLYKIIRQ